MTIQRVVLIFIFLLAFSNTITLSHTKKNNCASLLAKFSNVCQNFLGCAIHHAEPVQYCRKCGDSMVGTLSAYDNLLSMEECKSKYFDQDRINIVQNIYTSARSLWESGSCSNCYDWVEGNIHQNESAATTEFFNDLSNFSNCTQRSVDKKQICSECLDDYNVVNDIYEKLKKATNDKLCFDIKDAMNKTRLNWSHNLNCCKDRNTSLTVFIVTSVIISVLIPFVFYTSFMFFGWRRDQLQEPLIDSDEQHSVSRQTIETSHPSSSLLDHGIPKLLDVE